MQKILTESEVKAIANRFVAAFWGPDTKASLRTIECMQQALNPVAESMPVDVDVLA